LLRPKTDATAFSCQSQSFQSPLRAGHVAVSPFEVDLPVIYRAVYCLLRIKADIKRGAVRSLRRHHVAKTVFNLLILGGALVVLAWAVKMFYQPIFN